MEPKTSVSARVQWPHARAQNNRHDQPVHEKDWTKAGLSQRDRSKGDRAQQSMPGCSSALAEQLCLTGFSSVEQIKEQGRLRLAPNLSPSREGNIVMAKKHGRNITQFECRSKSTLRF